MKFDGNDKRQLACLGPWIIHSYTEWLVYFLHQNAFSLMLLKSVSTNENDYI